MDRPNISKLEGALKAAFPSTLAPMLASPAEKAFSSESWIFEPKMDGIRCLVAMRAGKATLLSRRGLDMTHQYPTLAAQLEAAIRVDAIVDGEIIALDASGKPSFQELQQRMNLTKRSDIERVEARIPAYFFAFDIIFAVDCSLTGMPLMTRKEMLGNVLTESDYVRNLHYFENDGVSAYTACVELGFEGIVAKRRDSRYEMGRRSTAWLKLKAQQTGDFVLAGYTAGTGWRSTTFGAILLGQYDDAGKLRYAGSVGTGFDDKMIRALMKRFEPLVTTKKSFAKAPEGKEKVTWLVPKLVAEIKFMDWTRDAHLRAPVFLRLRDDKRAAEATVEAPVPVLVETSDVPPKMVAEQRSDAYIAVETVTSPVAAAAHDTELSAVHSRRELELIVSIEEQLKTNKERATIFVGADTISVSNLGKVFWPATDASPAVTKRDYLNYLTNIGSFLLPHLAGRPLTVVRAPNGVNGKPFFQKHWKDLPEFFETTGIVNVDGEPQEFLLCNNLPTLLYVGQHSSLELHTMSARIVPFAEGEGPTKRKTSDTACDINELLEFPDYVVLDLDVHDKSKPPTVVRKEEFALACEVALALQAPLKDIGANTLVKLSGKGGLHIYLPVTRNLDYEHIRVISETLAQFAVKLQPDLATTAYKMEQRIGKVYVDTSSNMHRKTMIAPYSARLTAWGTVSLPVTWQEIERCQWIPCSMPDAVDRLRNQGDLWKNILKSGIDLHKSISGGDKK